MSIALLRDPHKTHDILDDFESLFWAKLFGAVKYFAGKISFDMDAFFDHTKKCIKGQMHEVGGKGKFLALHDPETKQIPFTCGPFMKLLGQLAKMWKQYYTIKYDHEEEPENDDYRKAFDEIRQKYSNPDFWVAVFDKHLAEQGWQESDAIEDRYPPQREKDAEVEVRKQLFTAIVATYDPTMSTSMSVNPQPAGDEAEAEDSIPPLYVGDRNSSLSPLPARYNTSVPDSPPPHSNTSSTSVFHPGPPRSVLNSRVSLRDVGSMPSESLNSNGKRSMTFYADIDGASDDDEPADAPSSPVPQAKRLKSLPIQPSTADREPRSQVRSGVSVHDGRSERSRSSRRSGSTSGTH